MRAVSDLDQTAADCHQQRCRTGSIYTKLAGFLTVLWICYPTIWAVGPSGLGIISQTTETVLFVVVPFFSKVGFSILDLNYLRDLAPRKPAHHHAA
ncbi:bacteriorhodopsin [Hymenobacter profundi]|uniref:Bacteriorhodopsin n=1 Tax=Hymenobacter profundi TaxID=1982110 RepID=A0ABS6WYX3_9BACT|nr:bacteriorhodopsin [Hymenobacter profundi]